MAVRIYLVIVDETEEAQVALRFASRRAAKTCGQVHLLAIVPRQEFVAFGGVQATIEQEARDKAEVMATSAAGNLATESGIMPTIAVRQGDGIKVVSDYLMQHPEVSALVLGSSATGNPGPLVTHFTSAGIGALSCPLYLVPGGLDEAAIDRLS